MGEPKQSAATTLAAVEQATAEDRRDLLKRLTKEMLPDTQQRIQLDDMVSQEVASVLSGFASEEPLGGDLVGDSDARVIKTVHCAQALWDLTAPFAASLQVASRWGTEADLAPWVTGIRAFETAAAKTEGGYVLLTKLRHLPGMASLTVAALACIHAGKWDNLRTLVVEPSVRDQYTSRPLPLLHATDPYAPFDDHTFVTPTLARAQLNSTPPNEALKDVAARRVGYHTPVAEWLHAILRPVFVDQLPDAGTYATEFDRAEVMLGLLSTDSIVVQSFSHPEPSPCRQSKWFGRSLWRSVQSHGNPIDEFQVELPTQGGAWPPLRAGLFGGDKERAQAALDDYKPKFERWSSGMW